MIYISNNNICICFNRLTGSNDCMPTICVQLPAEYMPTICMANAYGSISAAALFFWRRYLFFLIAGCGGGGAGMPIACQAGGGGGAGRGGKSSRVLAAVRLAAISSGMGSYGVGVGAFVCAYIYYI